MRRKLNRFFRFFLPAGAALPFLLLFFPPAAAQERKPAGSRVPLLRFQGPGGSEIVLDWKGRRWKILLWVKDDARFRLVLDDLARIFSASSRLKEKCDVLVIFPGKPSKETASGVEKIVLNRKPGLPVRAAFDPGGKNWDALGIIATPTTQVVDPKGILRFQLAGCPQDYLDRMARVFLERMGIQTPFVKGPAGKKAGRETSGAVRYVTTAKKLLAKGMPGLAAGILEKALAGGKPDLKGGALLGFLYLGGGKAAKARELFLSLSKAFPGALEPKVGLAACAVVRGDLDRADGMLAKLERERPDSAEVLYLKGVVFEKRGDLKEAAAKYKEAFLLGRPELRF